MTTRRKAKPTAPPTLHRLVIPAWHPARLNQWDGRHWSTRSRAKRCDRSIVAGYALQQRIPPATGKRRVSLVITLAPRQRAGDPDAYFKTVNDALVHAGLLLDDNRQGVELGTVEFLRGLARETEIVLEDLDDIAGPRRRSRRRLAD
jgi:Holliday junction resolvase RusA-like endonuclease